MLMIDFHNPESGRKIWKDLPVAVPIVLTPGAHYRWDAGWMIGTPGRIVTRTRPRQDQGVHGEPDQTENIWCVFKKMR